MSTAAQLFRSISQSDLYFPIRFPSLRRNMALEWSICCSFISHRPVHLRKWEKARQHIDQMWLSSSGTFTLIEFIPYSLWVALGRSYTHCYQHVFTPYFTETGNGSKWARWSPACVSVFFSECLIEWIKRKCANVSLLKWTRLMTFSEVSHCSMKCSDGNLYIVKHLLLAIKQTVTTG